MIDIIRQAAQIALPDSQLDKRNFWLGCIGIRKDGATVSSKNGSVFCTSIPKTKYKVIPSSHAECRVIRKLGKGGIIYVARISRKTGELAMSRPCPSCRAMIRSFSVKKVYYSINENQYGLWDPKTDTDIVFTC